MASVGVDGRTTNGGNEGRKLPTLFVDRVYDPALMFCFSAEAGGWV